MPTLVLRLFGTPTVEVDGRPVHVARRKALAVLAYLAATQQPQSRDVLAALLWPELGQSQARAMVRHALAALAHAVGPTWLVTAENRVALPHQPHLWVDLHQVRTRLAGVAVHHHPPGALCEACTATLAEAVDLARDPFLSGFTLPDAPEFELWQETEAAHLQQDVAGALGELTYVLARTDVPGSGGAIAYAHRWLELDPLHEPAHRTLMRLHAWSGDRAAALHHYAACVRLLAEELAIDPEPATVALAAQIRDGTLPGPEAGWEEGGPGPAQDAVLPDRHGGSLHNLPSPPTRFIGRSQELAQVAALLANPECRLLTLTGPGGIGKTRLAIQAARAQVERFAQGVHFVDLAPVAQGDLVGALLRSLAIPEAGARNPADRLLEHLTGRNLLMILDNCEHLLDESGIFAELVQRAPHVKLLVTSRVRLNLRHEWLLPLDGLTFPPEMAAEMGDALPPLEAYDAAQLFLHCMRRLQPGFVPTPDDARYIARICRLLAGIPLALELAAAWTHALPLPQLEHELAHSLHLLHSSLRDLPPRHQSMHAVFDHSWRLLDEHDRSRLRRLAVFRGGCTAEAAQAVAGASPDDLARLVDRSWLRLRANGRYEMHELVRQFCEERLDQEHAALTAEPPDHVRRRHGTFYGHYLADPMHKMNLAREAIDEVMAEFGNVQAGLRWAARYHDVTAIRWMTMTLYFVAEMLGRFHDVDQLYQALLDVLAPEVADRSDPVRWQEAVLMQGWVLWPQSNLCIYLAQVARGRALATHNLAMLAQVEPCDDRTYLEVMSQWVLTLCTLRGGDYAEGRRQLYGVLARYQDPNLPWKVYERPSEPVYLQAQIHSFLGHAALHLGEYDEAERMLRRSLAIREEIGERRFRSHHTSWLVRVLQVKGEYAEAEKLAQEGLRGTQLFGDRISEASSSLAMGRLECDLGRYAAARVHLQKCLDVAYQTGILHRILEARAELGRLELALGHPAAARQICEEALAAFERAGPVHSNNLPEVLVVLGWAALGEQDLALAEHSFRRVLELKGRLALDSLDALAGLGELLQRQGRREQAAALFRFVAAHPATTYTTRRHVARARQDLGEPAEAGPVEPSRVAEILGREIRLVS